MPDIAVIGAGAVGTVAASAAEQAGLDVVICARSPVSPVVLELDGQERRVAAPVVCDPGEAGSADWVLLAPKAQQTPQAGPWLARLCRPGTVVVVLQNGVDHVERVAPLAGAARGAGPGRKSRLSRQLDWVCLVRRADDTARVVASGYASRGCG